MPPLQIILDLSWGAFLLIWLIGAFRTKRDAQRGSSWSRRRLLIVARIVIAIALIAAMRRVLADSGIDERDVLLFRPTSPLAWTAAVLTVGGIGTAIWARVHLGRNWSPRPAHKEGHELVTSGPYRLVRHPIYSGLLAAVLGLAMTGSVAGPVSLVMATILFLRRMAREERIMMDLFPECYALYRQRTWRLVPHVW